MYMNWGSWDGIRRRHWNWIGHILHGERSSDCMVVLGWRQEGKRAVGRPKTTWRRTVEVGRWPDSRQDGTTGALREQCQRQDGVEAECCGLMCLWLAQRAMVICTVYQTEKAVVKSLHCLFIHKNFFIMRMLRPRKVIPKAEIWCVRSLYFF